MCNMGDAVDRGIAAVERAKRLHDAGNKEAAVQGYEVQFMWAWLSCMRGVVVDAFAFL